MAKTVLEEFVTILGFEIDGDDAQKYQETLDGIGKGLKVIATAAAAAATGVALYTRAVAKAVDENYKLSTSLDTGFVGMQNLVEGMEQYGVAAATTTGIIANMASILAGLPFGQAPHGALSQLGVTPTGNESPEQLFEKIFRALETKTPGQRLYLGGLLGFDLSTMNALGAGFDSLMKKVLRFKKIGAFATPEQGKEAARYADAVQEVGAVFRSVGNIMAFDLLPRFTKIAEAFTDWFVAAKESGKVRRALELITAALRPALIAIGLITAALALMNTQLLIAMAPFVALGVAIGLVAIAIDDVWAYFEGGPSILGVMIDKVKELAAMIADLAKQFLSLNPLDVIGDAWESIKGLALDAGFNDPMRFASAGATTIGGTSISAPISVNGAGIGTAKLIRAEIETLHEEASETSRGNIVR